MTTRSEVRNIRPEHWPEHFAAKARECYVPGYMIPGLVEYICTGLEPGGFLTAVLENDLMGALHKADVTNMSALPTYGRFLYNHAPSGCYGSKAKVDAWNQRGGLEGK